MFVASLNLFVHRVPNLFSLISYCAENKSIQYKHEKNDVHTWIFFFFYKSQGVTKSNTIFCTDIMKFVVLHINVIIRIFFSP